MELTVNMCNLNLEEDARENYKFNRRAQNRQM
jgi:hypothetical protein